MIVKCYNVPYTLLTLRREYNLHLIVFHFVQWCHVSNSFGDDDTDKLPRKQIIGGCHSTNKCWCIFIYVYFCLSIYYFTLHRLTFVKEVQQQAAISPNVQMARIHGTIWLCINCSLLLVGWQMAKYLYLRKIV